MIPGFVSLWKVSSNPWVVYGAPFGIRPGFYYAPPTGVVFGAGLAIGFGIGTGSEYSRRGMGMEQLAAWMAQPRGGFQPRDLHDA
jgi:hypothetical protein